MVQLIITVMAISLTAALVAATLNYMPGWLVDYNKAAAVSTKGFCRLERTTLDQIAASGGFPMTPLNVGDNLNGTPYAFNDGGLAGYMGARYRFLPPAPENATWRYGVASVNSTPTGYVCLDATATGLSEGAWRAMQALKQQLPSGQFVMGSACGSTVEATPTGFPAGAAVTLFVTPGFQATPSCS